MRDVFQRILDRVGVGVHRIDAPGVARVVVRGVADAVDGRIAQVDVARGSCPSLARRMCVPSANSPALHARGTGQGFRPACGSRKGEFLPASVSVPRLGAHFFGRLRVDIGMAGFDQLFGEVIHPLEIIRRPGKYLFSCQNSSRSPANARHR
jgi:hypothetical protein